MGWKIKKYFPLLWRPFHPDIPNQLLHSKWYESRTNLLLFKKPRIRRTLFEEKIIIFLGRGMGGGNSMKIINFLLKSILNSLQMRKIMFDSSICSNIAWNWLSYVIEEHNSLNKVSNQCFAKNWLSYYFSCWFLIYNNFILSVYNL